MKIEITYEPMTDEDIDEVAEALAVIIVRHFTEDYSPGEGELKKENSNNKAPNV